MTKKILILVFSLCLLTACSDSSGTAGESSNTDSFTVSDTTTTTESTTISTTTSFSEETTAAKPADAELWNNVKYVTIDGISFPIPNGYEIADGSGAQNKNFIKLDHGKIAIKKLDSMYEINHDMLERELNKINYSVNNPVKELCSCNHIGFGILSFSTKDGNEARIIVNGSSSAFMIRLIGDFSYDDYKQFCELVKFDSTNTTTTTASTTTTSETTTTTKATTTTQGVSAEFANALRSALSYLRSNSFSKEGLIHQLEYEKYSRAAAEYAVNNCGANWNEQALKQAQSYLRSSGFSKKGLIHQLEYEKFTSSEAAYGVANCGADWNEQAVKVAQSYLRSSSFSKQELIRQLIYEGFTQAEAQHGADVAYK